MKQVTSTQPTPPAIGDPYRGGFYGGQINMHGIAHAIVWAPKLQGELRGAWLDTYTSVPGATSCFDSMANTQAMAAAGSQLAKQALALDINGHTDWCLPARDVLELAYRHLKPTAEKNDCSFRDGDNPSSVPAGYPYTDALPAQTTVAAFQEGGVECFEERWYWSSTQYSDDYAWYQYFYDGTQNHINKSIEARARAVRMIPLNT